MTPRLVFVGLRRFDKHRPRTFVVAVWRRVRGRVGKAPAMWGDELRQAWKAVR